MNFRIDFVAIALVLGFVALLLAMLRKKKGYDEPHLLFPLWQSSFPVTVRSTLSHIPSLFFIAGCTCFALAFIDPHTVSKNVLPDEQMNAVPHEGIAIYFLLDQSGSMREEVPVSTSVDPRGKMAKIALMKQVTTRFIEGDPNADTRGLQGDLVGVVSFARGARVLAPLTLDHHVILEDIAAIQPMNSADNDGTAIGYAIYKTASMIAATRHYAQELQEAGQAPYEIKGSAIVVVTDGLQAPSPLDKGKRLRNMDIPEAAAYAKEQHVRVYIINIDPRITLDEFTPHRHIMERAAELTGGKFMTVVGNEQLASVYKEIARLEKGSYFGIAGSADQAPTYTRSFSLYPWLVALGLVCIGIAMMLETTALRRVP